MVLLRKAMGTIAVDAFGAGSFEKIACFLSLRDAAIVLAALERLRQKDLEKAVI